MMVRRRFLLLAAVLANAGSSALLAGIPSKKAKYRGGTLQNVEPSTKGEVDVTGEDHLVFRYDGGVLRIPYDEINALEYGREAARRWGLALAVSPMFLFSKKRKHFLTISFSNEEGGQETAVFELGKDIAGVTLRQLEARTGESIEYAGEEPPE